MLIRLCLFPVVLYGDSYFNSDHNFFSSHYVYLWSMYGVSCIRSF